MVRSVLDHPAKRGQLVRGGRGFAGIPDARDAHGAEARIGDLLHHLRPAIRLANGIVGDADHQRLTGSAGRLVGSVAAAACDQQHGGQRDG